MVWFGVDEPHSAANGLVQGGQEFRSGMRIEWVSVGFAYART